MLFSFKMYVFKEKKMSPMICIMLNPPQSLVFTKLLSEVLTLCDCVLLVLRSAILKPVPFDGEFHFVS